MDYWKDKEERAKEAHIHTKNMETYYGETIAGAVAETTIYGGPDRMPKEPDDSGTHPHKPGIILIKTDSVTAGFDMPIRNGSVSAGRTAVLNFASYKNPGGKFLQGSSAQEESLCHASYLFNILTRFDKTYYKWNREHLNHSLYTDRALYSPNVLFEKQVGHRQVSVRCFDVITCAAPNIGAAQRHGITPEENTETLKNRIRFIRAIAEEHGIGTLILGAYGCGVFRQDAAEVANLLLEEFRNTSIDRLVFPVPDDKNHAKFLAAMEQRNI